MDVDALKQLWDLAFTWLVGAAEMVMRVADMQDDVSDCSFHQVNL